MKRGTTPTLEIKLELNATNVTNVYFTFKEKVEDSDEFLLQKNYPEDATYDDEKEVFLLPLTQEDTLALTDTFFLEAEVVLGGKSVIKSDIGKEIMQPTLYTEVISGNESNGESDVISLSFTDYVEGGGSGGTTNYNELSNKPQINSIVLVGNKSASDLNLASKDELNAKADKDTTYTKTETDNLLDDKENKIAVGDGLKREGDVVSADLDTNSILEFNNHKLSADTSGLQPTISGGNGIDVSSDVVSVDIQSGGSHDYLYFNQNGQLYFDYYNFGYDTSVRESLTSTSFDSPLASKNYVDTALGNKQNKLTVGDGIDITNDVISAKISGSFLMFASNGLTINTSALGLSYSLRQELANGDSTTFALASKSNLADYQPKLTAGTNITIDSNNVISASGGGSYSAGNGIDITNDEISVDTTIGYDNTLRNRLVNTNYRSPLASKSYVDTELDKRVEKVQLEDNFIPLDDGVESEEISVNDYSFLTFDTSHLENDDVLTMYYKIGNTWDSKTISHSSWYEYVFEYDAIKFKVVTTPSGETREFLYSLYNDVIRQRQYSREIGNKQDKITSSNKLSADNVDDTNTTNKFTNATEKQTWNNKADNTTITTDTSTTTASLTLADNHEYRYTQELASLTLTMPSGDFISSIVFASGSTPTSMTYDSSIKWSGDDITNGQFVPSADKDYDIMMYYNGLNINGIVRGVS